MNGVSSLALKAVQEQLYQEAGPKEGKPDIRKPPPAFAEKALKV